MTGKKNIFKRLICSLLLLISAFTVFSVPIKAYEENIEAYSEERDLQALQENESTESVSASAVPETAAVNKLSVLSLSNIKATAYSKISVTRNSNSLSISALLINGTYYIPLRDFISKTTSMSVTYSAASRTMSVKGSGLELTAADGSYVVHANGRALFELTPARILSDGKMYIPAKTLAKALGLNLTEGKTLDFSGTVKPLASADKFYDADSVYWLSRIINAESRGEPFVGQIAVGNVIMNRVKSKSFPNTIWGVIFDKKYGVQFSPTANGAIYNSPTYLSKLAAMIALEGYSLSDDILYFLAPRNASSSWITSTRSYVFTVQNHEFYA